MVDLSPLGSTSLGIWRRTDALAVQTPGRIRGRLGSGEWRSPLRGLYCDGGYELSAEQWACAAGLVSGPGAVACGRSAARVWGLPLINDSDPATRRNERFRHEVSSKGGYGRLLMPPAAGDPRGHEVRRHRLTMAPGDVLQHPGGFLITSPLRTVVDAPGLLGHEAAVCLLDAALHRRLVSLSDLDHAAKARVGTAGSRALQRALTAADGRAESALETLGRLLLLPVLPGLVPQVTLRNYEGDVVARFDLADKLVKLAFEGDGKRGHVGEQMVAKDRHRDRTSEAFGWHTERMTWWDVRRQPDALVARATAQYLRLAARAS